MIGHATPGDHLDAKPGMDLGRRDARPLISTYQLPPDPAGNGLDVLVGGTGAARSLTIWASEDTTTPRATWPLRSAANPSLISLSL